MINVKSSDFTWDVEMTGEKHAGRGDWYMNFYVRNHKSEKYGKKRWDNLRLQKVCFLRGGPSSLDRRYNLNDHPDNSIGMLFKKMKNVAAVGIMKSAIKKYKNR